MPISRYSRAVNSTRATSQRVPKLLFLVYVSVECVPEVVERVPEVSGRTSRDLGVVGVGVVGVGVVGVGVVEVVLRYPGFGRYK